MKERIERHYIDNHTTFLKKANAKIKNIMDAEDIVQHTYELALRYQNTFRQDSDLDKWIGRIFANAQLKHHADNKRMGMSVEIAPWMEECVDLEDWQDNMAKRVKNHYEKYDADQRQAIYMYFELGYKPREIVECIPLTSNAVRSLLKRFKQKMEMEYGETVRL